MGNSAPRVTSSSGVYEFIPDFSGDRWSSLEAVLGRSMSVKEREDIFHLTRQYINSVKQEGEAVPTLREVSEEIAEIKRHAEFIINKSASIFNSCFARNSSAYHAFLAINSACSGGGDLVTQTHDLLISLFSVCDGASESLIKPRGYGYQKGWAWNHAMRMMLITINSEEKSKKDLENSRSINFSTFVLFVEVWQQLLDKRFRRLFPEDSLDALTKAVRRAVEDK